MIPNNQISKQDTQPVSITQKQKMNTIVNRIVELIKEKHL
jgi:hypothetical protein